MVWSADETARHVDGVRARAAAVAPEDLRAVVLEAARIHEERDPARLRALTEDEQAIAVALAFGEIWSEADLGAYATRHAAILRPLLLFELAHEGTATDAMRAVARAGDAGDEFAAWERALPSAS
jgi:hypothetical protein